MTKTGSFSENELTVQNESKQAFWAIVDDPVEPKDPKSQNWTEILWKVDCYSDWTSNDRQVLRNFSIKIKDRSISWWNFYSFGSFILNPTRNFSSKLFPGKKFLLQHISSSFLWKMTISNFWIKITFLKAFKNFKCLKAFKSRIKNLKSMR